MNMKIEKSKNTEMGNNAKARSSGDEVARSRVTKIVGSFPFRYKRSSGNAPLKALIHLCYTPAYFSIFEIL